MTAIVDVAIVGAGPYGLSIAAHLAKLGVEHRVIGIPMENWLHRMPQGMLLKSEGLASSLYDPDARLTLAEYCAQHGIAYADIGLPVPLEVFTDYALAFQRRFAPTVESRTVTHLTRSRGRFHLVLDDGEEFDARRVVVATGISHFQYLPDELAHLPAEFVTHSSAHRNLDQFSGRDVTVIGAGASAIDLATLLHERGAQVRLVTRRPNVEINEKLHLPRTLVERVAAPMSGIGPSWRSMFYANVPHWFHRLPERFRLKRTKRYLGPAGGYFMKERFSKVPHLGGYRLVNIDTTGGRALVTLEGRDGSVRRVVTEHVVAATGFRVDLRRVPFLAGELLQELRSVEHTPVLSSQFESSVRGLYFVGPAAANSFGPSMRFAFGARFTAPRIARHLRRSCRGSRRPGARSRHAELTPGDVHNVSIS
jgi:lysine/ornithine N-monooxygenase